MESPATPAAAAPPHESRSQRVQDSVQTPPSSSAVRLWRPAAQRNIRNQWSKLNSLRRDWRAASSTARSHATAVLNSYLSQTYMKGMDFGVLSDMPNIRKKAKSKMFQQQELYKRNLLSSYRHMVKLTNTMNSTYKSMRCYFNGTNNSPLIRFSLLENDNDSGDSGDCGGIPVFESYSVASFEGLALEFVQMFISELNLKRLVVLGLLSLYDEEVAQTTGLNWSDQLYDGEFNDLSMLNLCIDETHGPIFPPSGSKSGIPVMQPKQQQDSTILQVYLTTWLAEVNIDGYRVDEIFALVGSVMRVDFLETFGP